MSNAKFFFSRYVNMLILFPRKDFLVAHEIFDISLGHVSNSILSLPLVEPDIGPKPIFWVYYYDFRSADHCVSYIAKKYEALVFCIMAVMQQQRINPVLLSLIERPKEKTGQTFRVLCCIETNNTIATVPDNPQTTRVPRNLV